MKIDITTNAPYKRQMKLKNAYQKTQKALSWLFNNNGNQIDENLIRLTDSSPIHSTGLTRLSYNWEYGVAVGAPILYALYTDIDFKKALLNSLLSTTILYGTQKFRDYRFRKSYSLDSHTMCINKAPERNEKNIQDNLQNSIDSAYALRASNSNIMTSFAMTVATVIQEYLLATKSNYLLKPFMSPIFIGAAAQEVRSAFNYHKVQKNEWSIERMPPPTKKEKSEATDTDFLPEIS